MPIAHAESSTEVTRPSLSGRAAASASTRPGVFNVQASAFSSNAVKSAANAYSNYFDDLTISADGMYGQMARVTAEVVFDFDFATPLPTAPSAPPYVSRMTTEFRAIVTGYQDVMIEYGNYYFESINRNGDVTTFTHMYNYWDDYQDADENTTSLKLSWYVNLGIATSLEFQIFSSTFAEGNGSGEGSATASSSVYWGGIKSVVLANGVELNDYQATSVSGLDYTQSFAPAPVPEPQSVIMILAGLAIVHVGMARQRESKRA